MPRWDDQRMIGEVMEKAAGLAAEGEATVEGALVRYQQVASPFGSYQGQVWISVAFLLSRQAALAATPPD